MRGIILRKMMVGKKIDRLPAEERESARHLYNILDMIELCTVAPWTAGIVGTVFLSIAVFYWAISSGFFAELRYMLWSIPIELIASYLLSVLLLKVIYFNRRRKKEIHELEKVLSLNHQYFRILKKLGEIDPDMIRNIKRFIPYLQE